MRTRVALTLTTALGVAGATLLLVPRPGSLAVAGTAASEAAGVPIPPGAPERLAAALRIPTIARVNPTAADSVAFTALRDHLRDAFPLVHRTLEREVVAGHSLLYTWHGSDSTLAPILLAGHLDVIPVEEGTARSWSQPPFGGRIVDGFIWGRGAIDNKSAVVGTLEAVEMLLHSGFRPARTVMLAFGHDEEVGGTRGAKAIAERLARRGVRLEMVLDEGGVIGSGIMPGVARPTALVGIAEKGFVSVELSTRTTGGHSSLPPREGAIGILGAAIARLEATPMPARFTPPTRELFARLSPEFPAMRRAVLGNLWLTGPLVLRSLERTPTTNAMVRTTTAVTIFSSGTKENVLPREARAVVNFRILPGDSVADVLAHVREVVDDPRVAVRVSPGFTAEPSAVSSTGGEGFRLIERTIRAVSPDALVAPYLVVVVTDSRYYSPLSRDVFRFLPLTMTPRDLERMHGIDERIAVRDYEGAIRFYRQLILDGARR